ELEVDSRRTHTRKLIALLHGWDGQPSAVDQVEEPPFKATFHRTELLQHVKGPDSGATVSAKLPQPPTDCRGRRETSAGATREGVASGLDVATAKDLDDRSRDRGTRQAVNVRAVERRYVSG